MQPWFANKTEEWRIRKNAGKIDVVKNRRKQVLQKNVRFVYAPHLRAIKSNGKFCAVIISHLYERAFSMNNLIDLLFWWRISLRMYCALFFFFRDESKSWRVTARKGSLSTTHFTFQNCLEWCFARVIFITLLYTYYRCVRYIVTLLAESIAVHYHNCAFIVITLLQSVSASINKK